MYNYFRHIKTTQERRASQDGWGRPKRNLHNLPSAWDDIPRHIDRCWKRYRKTQYKTKSVKPKRSSRAYARSMSKRDHFDLNHKRCCWSRRRCSYCIKHGIWDEYDKRQARRYRKRRREEEESWQQLFYCE